MKVKQIDHRGREYETEIDWDGTFFDLILLADKENALRDLVKAVQKLTLLELTSRKAFNLHEAALKDMAKKYGEDAMLWEQNGQTMEEDMYIFDLYVDSVNASKAVNEFWKTLQENGMSDYIPESQDLINALAVWSWEK